MEETISFLREPLYSAEIQTFPPVVGELSLRESPEV